MSQHVVSVNALQPAPGEPLYAQVATALRKRLDELDRGEMLPPERMLVDEYGVSRITLRRAVDLLVDEHRLVRRRGLGTFVAGQPLPYALVGLHSTRDIARSHGVTLDLEIFSFEVGAPSPQERGNLNLHATDRVVRFVRRDLAEEPLALARCVLPDDFAPVLSVEQLLQHSTYDLIEKELGIKISSARQRMYAEEAAEDVADLLRINVGSALFVIDRVTFDEHGTPLEWGVITYPASRIACVVDLFRGSGSKQESATSFALKYAPRPDSDAQ